MSSPEDSSREIQEGRQAVEQKSDRETAREKLKGFLGAIKERFARFGSRKQSSQEAMQAVKPEARFTDEEQRQLNTIEATAQEEAQQAEASLEKIDTEIPDIAKENRESQSVEPEKERTVSIDDLLEIAQEKIEQQTTSQQPSEAMKQAEGTPQEQPVQAEAEKGVQSREFIERMKRELEAIQAEKKKQESTKGRLQYYILTNQGDKFQEELKLLGRKEDYYLKLGEKIQTVEYGTQSWKQRAEQPIGSPEQFLKQIQMDMKEAQKKAQEAPPVEPYYEKFKQDKGEMFLQKGPYASEEEAKAAFDLYTEKVWATGRTDKIYYQHRADTQKRTLEGFTHAALESNDLETAIGGLDIGGQLENSEAAAQLRDKMLALKESSDPKDRERLIKAGQKLQKVKSRKAAEAQTS